MGSLVREMAGPGLTLVSSLLVCLLLHEASAQSQGSFLLRFPFLRPFSLSSLGSLNTRERDRRPDKPVIVRASRVHKGVDRVIGLSTQPPPARVPSAVLDNQALASTEASAGEVVSIDYESDSEFVILENPIGAGGQCRRNYHCRGRERCVLRFRQYICTTIFCNEDDDCADN